ncbi:MAG: hypothetical protein ACK59M_00230 [Pseudomonadota bacterium]|jgi:hypothetical protein
MKPRYVVMVILWTMLINGSVSAIDWTDVQLVRGRAAFSDANGYCVEVDGMHNTRFEYLGIDPREPLRWILSSLDREGFPVSTCAGKSVPRLRFSFSPTADCTIDVNVAVWRQATIDGGISLLVPVWEADYRGYFRMPDCNDPMPTIRVAVGEVLRDQVFDLWRRYGVQSTQ